MQGLSFQLKVEPTRLHRTQISSLCHPRVIRLIIRTFSLSLDYLPYLCSVVQTLCRFGIAEREKLREAVHRGKDHCARIVFDYVRDLVLVGLGNSKLG